MTFLGTWQAAVLASVLLAASAPERGPADLASLAAQLADPATRGPAFCEVIRQARHPGNPLDEEGDGCAVSHVIVAPQGKGPPVYVVFRALPQFFPEARLGSAKGPFTLVDAAGYVIPAHGGSNVLESHDTFFQYAGDARLALAQVVPSGGSGWTAQVLEVVPVTPEQRPVLQVVVGPPLFGGFMSVDHFEWTWALRSVGGSPPVVQIGPKGPDGQMAAVAAEFTYSPRENRYLGPAGSSAQGFLSLDPACEKCFQQASAAVAALRSAPPHAEPRNPAAPFRRSRATLCTPETSEYQASAKSLSALSDKIAKLGSSSTAQLDAANRALSDLLMSRCFAVSEESPRSVVAPTAQSLKTWWKDGGEAWLRSYLALAKKAGEAEPRFVVLPPDMRPEASLESVHAERGVLVCQESELGCGEETEGWKSRAARDLSRPQTTGCFRQKAEEKDTIDTCRDKAGTGPVRYEKWRSCLEAIREVVPAMPIGRFKAPKHGWFVVVGRRGHYDFCDEIRAYDLATGAAFVARRCGGLVLKPGGAVDHAATDRARGVRVSTGRLSIDNLREAAWMAILAGEVKPAQIEAQYFQLPEGMIIEWPSGSSIGHSMGGSHWGSTSQTHLAWQWVDSAKVLAAGHLTWPNSSEAGENHAAELLEIAEAGMVEGAVTSPLPDWVLADADPPGVSHLDATRSGLADTNQDLREALLRLSTPRPAK